MAREERTTILERITKYSGQNLAKVFEATKNSHTRYIANLILTSQEIAKRSEATWEYKSLTHFGEEQFVNSGNAHWFLDRQGEFDPGWHQGAAKEFGECVCRNLWYSETEGLVLYVNEGGKFRPAQEGDAPFDFVQRLRADDMTVGLALDRPPSWANELFIYEKNLEAYALIWYDNSDTSSASYASSKRAKAEAVWRETKRLMGEQNSAAEKVRTLAVELPKSRLISITAIVAGIANLSAGKATIPELVDALGRCHDCETMMIYKGDSYGLATAIDGSPFDDHSGYNARADIICELFNTRYWKESEATIRGIAVENYLVLKEDAATIAQQLWKLFFNESLDDPLNALGLEGLSMKVQPPLTSTESDGKVDEGIESGLDPADLPAELDAANIAFRAVTQGYGDPLVTFKNRLIDYLKKNFPNLGHEAVQRIATVANPDKTTGRKKRD
ncbi:MAG: hypothetical protein V4454_03420 [Pseudomonadota bacterium]